MPLERAWKAALFQFLGHVNVRLVTPATMEGVRLRMKPAQLGVGKERIRERPDKSWSKPVLKSTPIMDIDMGGNKLTYGLALIWVSKSWGAPLGNLPISANPSVVSTPSL